MQQDKFYLLGLASGLAGADITSGKGPLAMQQSTYMQNNRVGYEWVSMLQPATATPDNLVDALAYMNTQLATQVTQLMKQNKPFCVIAGDHTSAIGTWSGVYAAMQQRGQLGLIWIDAHMDSHTPQTSLSGNIHGMPLAVLLGHGVPQLTSILNTSPKLRPENVCLIGVRSYEDGEAALLKSLNVKIYFMDEVKQRGFVTVLREAVEWVNKYTVGYGISLDIDGLDPLEAPGVDVPEPDGIHVTDLLAGFAEITSDPRLLATEVVEFDPSRDKQGMTEKVVADVVQTIAQGQLNRGTAYVKAGSERG